MLTGPDAAPVCGAGQAHTPVRSGQWSQGSVQAKRVPETGDAQAMRLPVTGKAAPSRVLLLLLLLLLVHCTANVPMG